MKYIIFILILFSFFSLLGFTDRDRQYLAETNFFENPGAELGLVGFNNINSGTLRTATGQSAAYGNVALDWTVTDTDQRLQTDKHTIPARLRGNLCEAGIVYQTAASDGDFEFEVWAETVGGTITVLANVGLPRSNVYSSYKLFFECPNSSTQTIYIVIDTQTDDDDIKLDQFYLGEPRGRGVAYQKDVQAVRGPMYAEISFTSGVPSVDSQVPDFIASITDTGTGDVTVNFSSDVCKGVDQLFCWSNVRASASSIANPTTSTVTPSVTQKFALFQLSDGARVDASFRFACFCGN